MEAYGWSPTTTTTTTTTTHASQSSQSSQSSRGGDDATGAASSVRVKNATTTIQTTREKVEAYERMLSNDGASSARATSANGRVREEDIERATRRAFVSFSKFGRATPASASTSAAAAEFDAKARIMDATRFAKVCREVFFPGDAMRLRACEIAYEKRRGSAHRKIDYETFKKILTRDIEGVDFSRLVNVTPSVGGAVSPSAHRLHDDVSTYTGASGARARELRGIEKSPSRRGANATPSATTTSADAPLVSPASLPLIRGLRASYDRFTQFSPSSSELTASRWAKLCEDCGLFDIGGAVFNAVDAGIVFSAVLASSRKITLDFDHFRIALECTARRASASYAALAARVADGVPRVRTSTPVLQAVRLADDKDTYTATHREVHDAKTLTPRAMSIRREPLRNPSA